MGQKISWRDSKEISQSSGASSSLNYYFIHVFLMVMKMTIKNVDAAGLTAKGPCLANLPGRKFLTV